MHLPVDLHLHTRCSDGTMTPEQLVAHACARGLVQIAVTDHDTTAGIAAARRAAAGHIAFVPGVEITTCEELFLPNEAPFSVHILGYGIREDAPGLNRPLERRAVRMRALFESLCADLRGAGLPVRIEDVPIRCNRLMQLSDVQQYAETLCRSAQERCTVSDLSARYSARLSAANLTSAEAVEAIRSAGGHAVWAHPFHIYRSFQKRILSEASVAGAVPVLKERGAEGLEADYLSFSLAQREFLHGIAARSALFTTAGADFHGFAGRDGMGVEVPALFSFGTAEPAHHTACGV